MGEFKFIAVVPVNGKQRFIEFDTIKDRQVQEGMTIASQPISSGESVSDHAYRNPTTVSFNASFSNRGSWQNKVDCYQRQFLLDEFDINSDFLQNEGAELKEIIDEKWARLSNIEIFWKWVMKHGILVDLMMIDVSDDSGKVRFTEKKNMAIQSLTFTERYDSIEANFSFKEIILVSTNQFEEIANYGDMYPSTTMPDSVSLGEILCNNDNIMQTIVQELCAGEKMSPEAAWIASKGFEYSVGQKNGFLAIMEVIGNGILAGVLAGVITAVGVFAATIGGALAVTAATTAATAAVAAATGAAVAATTATTAGTVAATAASAIFPVGTIVAAIACVAVIAGVAIAKGIKNAKMQKAIKLVINWEQYVDDDGNLKQDYIAQNFEMNMDDYYKLRDILNRVENAIKNQFSDIKCLSLSNSIGDNKARTFSITTGNDTSYGVVTNEGTTEEPSYKLYLYDGSGDDASPRQLYNSWAVVTDFDSANDRDYLIYADSDGDHRLYIINPNLGLEVNASEDANANVKKTLTGYYLLITNRFTLQQLGKNISDTITKALGDAAQEVLD